MKPRNREITIFNLSMLDVISGAVGAFLIITVVLFPSYAKNVLIGEKNLEQFKKVQKSLAAELQRERQKPRQDPREVEDKNRQLETALAKIREQRQAKPQPVPPQSRTNLGPALVVAFGGMTHDVALAVVPERPGTPAVNPEQQELSTDPAYYASTLETENGGDSDSEAFPTPQLVLIPKAIPGVSYQIYYKLTRSVHGYSRFVGGQVSYGGNTWELPPHREVELGQWSLLGSFTPDKEGMLQFSFAIKNGEGQFNGLNSDLVRRLRNEKRKKAEAKSR